MIGQLDREEYDLVAGLATFGNLHSSRGARVRVGAAFDQRAANDPLSELHGPVRVLPWRAQPREDFLEVEAANVGPDDQEADDEAGVADAVGDERLVGSVRGALPLVIEANQQVRADADQLPAYENLKQIVGQDQ